MKLNECGSDWNRNYCLIYIFVLTNSVSLRISVAKRDIKIWLFLNYSTENWLQFISLYDTCTIVYIPTLYLTMSTRRSIWAYSLLRTRKQTTDLFFKLQRTECSLITLLLSLPYFRSNYVIESNLFAAEIR